MDIDSLLAYMVKRGASDMFITEGVGPSFKVNGKMEAFSKKGLSAEQVRRLVFSIMTEEQIREYEREQEVNFAIHRSNIGRFRVNVFQQQNNIGMVLRRIQTVIPTFEQLGLPDVAAALSMTRRGLVIVVGATGSGKSTTLASMVGFRNRHSSGHIVTIEEPVEYLHRHQGCIVTQREVGIDTRNYEAALRNTLRQAPDVILIGEVRSREVMEHAVTFAETGHLCLTTLHATNASQSLDRILNFFPEERRSQVCVELSMNLRAIIAQRLVPRIDRKGRVLAVEVMINTPRIADLIRNGEFHEIRQNIAKGEPQGMLTFDQSLFGLYKEGKISYEDAVQHADSENELRLMIKLGKGTQEAPAAAPVLPRAAAVRPLDDLFAEDEQEWRLGVDEGEPEPAGGSGDRRQR